MPSRSPEPRLEHDLNHRDALDLLQRQADVLEMVAAGRDLKPTLASIVTSLEELMPGARCSVLLFRPDTQTLHHGAAPRLPDAYISAIDGMRIGPRAGSCGTAVHTAAAVVATDIDHDDRWTDFRAFAIPHGLRSCWSTPIEGRSGITGTFAVYHDESHQPTAREQMLIDRFTHLASVAIDHAAAEGDRSARIEADVARRVAESASHNKSQFVAAMSHDLRTPLQAIAGFTEMLRTMEMPAERRQTALEHIARATEHITELVDDVLDIARIEEGTLPLRMVTLPIGDAVAEVVDFVGPLAQTRNVLVKSGYSSARVLADALRLRQVLLNLVSNAIIYNEPGGSVDVRFDGDEAAVTIIISNTGPGIPSDKLDRIFVPFDRLGAEESSEPGVGLGLSLALGLTEAMAGTLQINSVPGDTTTATVRLQRATG